MTMKRRRNVAKLLARLNTKAMALQPSPGNTRAVALETPLDIAAALGWASAQGSGPRLAALVLCLRWWPAIFEAPARVVGCREIRRAVTRTVLTGQRDAGGRAIREQARSVEVVKVPIEAPGETPAYREIVGLLERSLRNRISRDRALAAEQGDGRGKRDERRVYTAPLDDDLYARVVTEDFMARWTHTLIEEYRHPNHCQTCTPWGKAGEVPSPVSEGGKIIRVEWVTCPTCDGGGTLAWATKRRAKAVSIAEDTFRNNLRAHHNGALSLLRELETKGAGLMLRHLGHDSDER